MLKTMLKKLFNTLLYRLRVWGYQVWAYCTLAIAGLFVVSQKHKKIGYFYPEILSWRQVVIVGFYEIYYNFLASNKFYSGIFKPFWFILFEIPLLLIEHFYIFVLLKNNFKVVNKLVVPASVLHKYDGYIPVRFLNLVFFPFAFLLIIILVFSFVFISLFFLVNWLIIYWFNTNYYRISPVRRYLFWREGDHVRPFNFGEYNNFRSTFETISHSVEQKYFLKNIFNLFFNYVSNLRQLQNSRLLYPLYNISETILLDNFIFILPEIVVFFSIFYFLIRALGLLELTKHKLEYVSFLLKLWRNIEFLVYFIMILTFAEIVAIRIHELTLRFYSRFTNYNLTKDGDIRLNFDLISPYSDFKAQVLTTDYPSTKAWALYSPSFRQLHVPAFRLKERYINRSLYFNPKLDTINSIWDGFSPRSIRILKELDTLSERDMLRVKLANSSNKHEAALIEYLIKLTFSKKENRPYDYWDPISFSVGSFSEFFNKLLMDPKKFFITTDILYAINVTNSFKNYWNPRQKYFSAANKVVKVTRKFGKPWGEFGPREDLLLRLSRGLSTTFYEKFLDLTKSSRRFPYRDVFMHYQRVPSQTITGVGSPNFLPSMIHYSEVFNRRISSLEDSGYKYAPIRPTTTGYVSSLWPLKAKSQLPIDQSRWLNENFWLKNRTFPYSLEFGLSSQYQFFLFDNLLLHDIFYLGTKLFFLFLFFIFLKLLRVTVNSFYIIQPEQPFLIASLLLFFLIALMSIDLNLLYLCFESITIIIVILIAYEYSEFSVDAAVKYFSLNAIISGLFIFGTSIFYGYLLATEFLNINDFFFNYSVLTLGYDLVPILFALSLIIISFFVKLGVWPGSLWVFDVYAGCSIALLFLISVVLKIVILFIFIRLLLFGFFYLFFYWKIMILFSAIGSLLFSSIGLSLETRLNSFIAYSSIGQFGFIMLGFTCYPSLQSLNSILLYTISYCTSICGFFMLLPIIFGRLYTNDNVSKFLGLYRKNLFLAIVLTVLLASLAGLPPFLGFFTKYRILVVLVSSTFSISLVLLILLTTALTTYGYFRLVAFIWFDGIKVNSGGLNNFFTTGGYIVYKPFCQGIEAWGLWNSDRPRLLRLPIPHTELPSVLTLSSNRSSLSVFWIKNPRSYNEYNKPYWRNKYCQQTFVNLFGARSLKQFYLSRLIKRYDISSFFIFLFFIFLHAFGFFTIELLSFVTEYYAFHFFYPNLVDSWGLIQLRSTNAQSSNSGELVIW